MAYINHHEYRKAAKSKLPKYIFDYLEGGVDDENCLNRNIEAFERIEFTPKRFVDIKNRTINTTIFNKNITAPFMIAPTGLNGLFHPDGDLALARAASKTGIPFILSTASTSSIEEVARHADGELWFQLYVIHKELAKQFVKRAKDSDYKVLMLTVDVSVNGYRERDIRNGFSMPFKMKPSILYDSLRHPSWTFNMLKNGMPKLANFETSEINNIEIQAALMSREMDASFDWKSLQWLRDLWPHKLVVKGLSSIDDVKKCSEYGIDAVVMSNHGGRQLDSIVSPIESLSKTTFSESPPIFIDSGIRRGSDIVKSIALGAEAALIGRPFLWALAAGGESCVIDLIEHYKSDIDRTLAHIGCNDIKTLNSSFIQR